MFSFSDSSLLRMQKFICGAEHETMNPYNVHDCDCFGNPTTLGRCQLCFAFMVPVTAAIICPYSRFHRFGEITQRRTSEECKVIFAILLFHIGVEEVVSAVLDYDHGRPSYLEVRCVKRKRKRSLRIADACL